MQQQSRPRILVISHDVVGRQMAGPGIRAWHMALALAPQAQVALIAPRPIDLTAPGLACGSYTWGDAATLAPWLAAASLVVANGFVLEAHPELAALPQPLALDLYDPVQLENLELLRAAPAAERTARAQADQRLLARALAVGDFFLCATERQRDLYLGALMLAGRLTPALADADPLARGLIDVAPFGLDPAPPTRQGPALRVLPGIGPADPLLLWTGGLWDWLDPLTLIDAMPALIARHPTVRLVFLAGKHPGTAGTMRMPALARARAAERGLLGTHISFYDQWVPYERRADFLLDATVAVSLHRNHLETAYAAVRSRFLDHLWAGLPSLVSAGDAAADLVRAHGLGRVAAIGDAADVAHQLDALLARPAELARCAENARALAHQYTWEQTLAPLLGWAERAAQAPKRPWEQMPMHDTPPEPTPPAVPPAEFAALAELIAQAEALWEISRAGGAPGRQPKELLRTAVQQAAAPVYGQQAQFNAVLVRALYWLSAEAQRAETRDGGLQHQVWALERQLNDVRNLLARVLPELNDRLAEEERATTVLAEAIAETRLEATN